MAASTQLCDGIADVWSIQSSGLAATNAGMPTGMSLRCFDSSQDTTPVVISTEMRKRLIMSSARSRISEALNTYVFVYILGFRFIEGFPYKGR